MSVWIPDISKYSGPRYKAIAAAMADAIRHGDLPVGMRLPTHRHLADALGVTVGTVTRAYAEAERLGLVEGRVGKGTFVSPPRHATNRFAIHDVDDDVVDLSLNLPPRFDLAEPFRRSADALAQDPQAFAQLMAYHPEAGLSEQRQVLARWAHTHLLAEADAARMVLTAGGQHAIDMALRAVLRAGDVLLTEQLTYPGVLASATQQELVVRPVLMDEEGLCPEALESACRQYAPRALYCTPTLQNPTTATMSLARREAIIDVCRRHQVMIIEDQVNGPLADQAPLPLQALHPEGVILVGSVSKVLSGALRTGFVIAPERWVPLLGDAVRASCWMASPLTAAIACDWIQNGFADELLQGHRELMREAASQAHAHLEGYDLRTAPCAMHAWLTLPEPLRAEQFVAEAARQGVLIKSAGTFAVGQGAVPQGIRLALSGAPEPERLARGLEVLKGLLEHRSPLRRYAVF
ncbi:MAG: PLP-dependent aminotransferase family protein [Gammaproteobacteria bacterium]|nr:MAG: PLP-dependent aminotransferase family protein [Gammaproteobacteria bacterium]